MTVWIYRSGELVDRGTVPPLPAQRSAFPAPQLMRDIPEYISPTGSGLITSRSHRREDLKRSDCRELDPSEGPKEPYKSEKLRKRYSAEERKRIRNA